jgi:hypothetical protein
MHLHLVLMQILDRQPFLFTNDMIVLTGPRVPPPANEAGWKDTVRSYPSEITRVIARFDGFAGRYPYHCHIIEHEDHEMMRQFQVVLPPRFTAIGVFGTNVVLQFTSATNLLHAVERRDELIVGSWTSLTNNLLGTGGPMVVTNTGAGRLPKRFYRLGVTP